MTAHRSPWLNARAALLVHYPRERSGAEHPKTQRRDLREAEGETPPATQQLAPGDAC
jgi:hypothetical protein